MGVANEKGKEGAEKRKVAEEVQNKLDEGNDGVERCCEAIGDCGRRGGVRRR